MLTDKVVMITGAGSGLGRELAKAFCQKGATVLGVGRNVEALKETGSQRTEGDFVPVVADVSDFTQIKNAVETMLAVHKRIDILFNNAAVYPKENFLQEDAEVFASALAINMGGLANCCKAVLPAMIAQNFGRVYNLGSWAHLGPIANSAVYSATKGGVHALTKGIAVDVASAYPDADIEIHEWIPGHLNTQMSDYTGMEPAQAASWAVAMAERPYASKRNSIFEQSWEWQPPRSLKERVTSKLMFWKK